MPPSPTFIYTEHGLGVLIIEGWRKRGLTIINHPESSSRLIAYRKLCIPDRATAGLNWSWARLYSDNVVAESLCKCRPWSVGSNTARLEGTLHSCTIRQCIAPHSCGSITNYLRAYVQRQRHTISSGKWVRAVSTNDPRLEANIHSYIL